MKVFSPIFLLWIFMLCSCSKPSCGDRTFEEYYQLGSYYKDFIPFRKSGFLMELINSSNGKKAKLNCLSLDSGYWERNQYYGYPDDQCGGYVKTHKYQYYDYYFLPEEDSMLVLSARLLCGARSIYYDTYGNHGMDLIVNGSKILIDFRSNYFLPEIVINSIKYDSVYFSNENSSNFAKAYFNPNKGIVALRINGQLWQQE